MKRRFFNPVQLHGQCKLNLNTGMSITHLNIPAINFNRQNNADTLIDDVLYFAVMRLGTDRLLEVVNDKITEYEGKYKEQGLYPDDKEPEDIAKPVAKGGF